MPRHKSAKDRMKTNARDTAKNRGVMSQVRAAVRVARNKPKDADPAKLHAETSSVLDRAVRRGVIKKSTANRQKSRLAKALSPTVATS